MNLSLPWTKLDVATFTRAAVLPDRSPRRWCVYQADGHPSGLRWRAVLQRLTGGQWNTEVTLGLYAHRPHAYRAARRYEQAREQ